MVIRYKVDGVINVYFCNKVTHKALLSFNKLVRTNRSRRIWNASRKCKTVRIYDSANFSPPFFATFPSSLVFSVISVLPRIISVLFTQEQVQPRSGINARRQKRQNEDDLHVMNIYRSYWKSKEWIDFPDSLIAFFSPKFLLFQSSGKSEHSNWHHLKHWVQCFDHKNRERECSKIKPLEKKRSIAKLHSIECCRILFD